MKHTFKPSKLIGLFALLVGLMAFSATAAQAEIGAYWEVGGTKIEGASELLPKINAKNDTPTMVILISMGLSKIEFSCTAIEIANGLLHKLGSATGNLRFKGCVTKLNGKTQGACTPHSTGAELGVIETNSIYGLLKLHKEAESEVKRDLIQLSPLGESAVFMTLELGPKGKSECLLLLGEIPIEGKIFLKDSLNELLVNKLEHLFEEDRPLNGLFFGGSRVTIDGSFWAFLEGKPHGGMEWSGHPA